MVGNTTAELVPGDDDARALTAVAYDGFIQVVAAALRRAQASGEVAATATPETQAEMLLLRTKQAGPAAGPTYPMTATAPDQVAFMPNTGNPISAEARKTFTEVAPPTRLAYLSLNDFVPGHKPYELLTTIGIEPADDRTNVVVTVDPLHDETWTQQYRG